MEDPDCHQWPKETLIWENTFIAPPSSQKQLTYIGSVVGLFHLGAPTTPPRFVLCVCLCVRGEFFSTLVLLHVKQLTNSHRENTEVWGAFCRRISEEVASVPPFGPLP